ncbi:MAG: pyruvate kinase [Clostridia bacterium]|nr:pyruvate kinase [Clostridia bacterium]
MRKTKIVCTIGPACANRETLTAMCKAGMNVARLNFSHGDHSGHLDNINLIKEVRQELGLPIAILLDTKGPEYRIGKFQNGSVTLNEGDTFTFTDKDIIGNESIVSVSYKNLASELNIGSTILLNNGLITFEVTEIVGNDVICKVIEGGKLSDRKSMSFPGVVLKQKYLSEQDKSDILFGIKNGIDFIACSFVSCKQDLIDIKEFIESEGFDTKDIELIAKIENRAGVDNIDEICEECSGIMVARGDLGVEIPFVEVPAIQKRLITKCRLLGKRVITATEMLESMIYNPRPTRAEISDVANAVFDGTSAIMLSGETAAGKYPELTVSVMAKIAERAENSIEYDKIFRTYEFRINDLVDAISHATCGMAIDINASVIAACSLSGKTARMISRFRPPVDILGLTTNEKTWRKLALSWGITPALCEVYQSTDVLFFTAKNMSRDVFGLKPGDRVVVTGGITNGSVGNTNIIKVETI